MNYKKIANVSDIPTNETRKYDLNELEITIANVEGVFYAFEDRCPHMNAPLHQGKIEGNEIVCPFHKARFDVTSGKKTKEPKIPIPKAIKIGSLMANVRTHDLRIFEVKVDNEQIMVKL